jgi:uncharacterized protein (DUF433 family)
MDAVAQAVPLKLDSAGVYRVGGTRVTLDSVVRSFQHGATAEEIVQDYPSLDLADVYQVLGYYLKHKDELADYFAGRSRSEKALLSGNRDEWSPKGLRARLLSRRKAA